MSNTDEHGHIAADTTEDDGDSALGPVRCCDERLFLREVVVGGRSEKTRSWELASALLCRNSAKHSQSLRESLTSLHSSILAFQEENGRTYHALSAGKNTTPPLRSVTEYILPNDDGENDRLDLQHHLDILVFEGRLALCPKAESGAKQVLDVGTGTGIWAIEFADLHPEANVIGVDLSPIQPDFIPPNCTFEIDDVEKEWTWSKPFDFVFARHMCASFQDYQGFVDKAFSALEPGGYLEMQDLDFPMRCDDDTMSKDSYIYKWTQGFVDAGENLGRPINSAPKYKRMLEKAGFVDVVEKQFKWPMNRWPREKKFKEIGQWAFANVDGGLEGLSLASFTRGLGWSKEETLAFCMNVRKDLKNVRIHGYWAVYVVYGKKPGDKGKGKEGE
ncbi:hypothetical protein MKZ38_003867 [Zalerion maritima]|uniref:Methyltransferase n=1 Tax=Zalerion maritima TaxID=339359 RepID=A0AAD5WRF0_9PEZI|nr:hypothetical protein MKZ38_003867 [Zalerion maritima]